MTTYYASIRTGSNANNGTTYALAKANITNALALCAAGDSVKVAPGTYREKVASAANGTAGNPITIIADRTGESTDGIGGDCRVTGSDNDTSATRTNGFAITHNYHTIRGFNIDTTTDVGISFSSSASNGIVEDCWVFLTPTQCVVFNGAGTNTVRRTIGIFKDEFVQANDSSASTCNVENCVSIVLGTGGSQIHYDARGTMNVTDCTVLGGDVGIYCPFAFTATVRNTTFSAIGTLFLTANASAVINYAYCNRWLNTTLSDTSGGGTVTDGGNNTNVSMFMTPFTQLLDASPVAPFGLHPDCTLRDKTDNAAAPTDDFYARARAPTNALRDWGAVDSLSYGICGRESSTVRTGSYSLSILGYGCEEKEVAVVNGTPINVSARVKWESNATIGTKPKITLDGCGLALTATATGDGSTDWEKLSVSGTPTATGIAILRLWNQQTDTTKRKVFFDDASPIA
jgi:hypothetical protein